MLLPVATVVSVIESEINYVVSAEFIVSGFTINTTIFFCSLLLVLSSVRFIKK